MTHLAGNDAEQVHGLRVAGIGVEDLTVDSGGLGEATGLVVADSDLQGFLSGGHLGGKWWRDGRC
jgi:hypothetical protein